MDIDTLNVFIIKEQKTKVKKVNIYITNLGDKTVKIMHI